MPIIHFNPETFRDEVTNSNKVVLVDFWADWCVPCQNFAPIIDELAEDYKDTDVIIGKVDIQNEAELAKQYRVMSIPTVLMFKDGKEVSRQVGAVPKEKLAELIETAK